MNEKDFNQSINQAIINASADYNKYKVCFLSLYMEKDNQQISFDSPYRNFVYSVKSDKTKRDYLHGLKYYMEEVSWEKYRHGISCLISRRCRLLTYI